MAATHKFQAPKGTRDFLPADMALRRHVESVWRSVSVAHGFDEVDGPTYEHLELYTVKSGPGIVSELFSFRRAGGETDYALRPEFTPTLARMVAANAATLPKPVKWFCIPAMFRAERPQRGRLREHLQWNVDLVGDDSPRADAEVVAVGLASLDRLGLDPTQARLRLSHRGLVVALLESLCGLTEERREEGLQLLDRREKIAPDAFARQAEAIGIDAEALGRFDEVGALRAPLAEIVAHPAGVVGAAAAARLTGSAGWEELLALAEQLDRADCTDWCDLDLSIVRGLAYYTGCVFEVHEARGRERAIAGGGRYDRLVELFGGPPTPAVGFAMGDVVIRLVLEEHGLLDDPAAYLPRPDLFVVNAREDEEPRDRLVARLRRAGLHVRHGYRATRNVGKLLGEASKARARLAVILGREWDEGRVVLKDLEAGTQEEIAVADLLDRVRPVRD